MTALQLAMSELKRMTAGLLPKIAIIALTIVPLLYGATYLYANWDPQSHISNLTAALVVEDRGAADQEGNQQQLGQEVAKSLHESHSFTWRDVSSVEEAQQGVEAGTYSFALVIPENFSADLLSSGNVRPDDENGPAVPGLLEVITNDANNYMINTFVDKLLTEVHDSVARQIGTTAADKFLTSFGVIHTNMVKAADGADQLHDGSTKLRNGTGQLAAGTKQLADGSTTLHEATTQLNTGASGLSKGASTLSSGASALDEGVAELQAGQKNLRDGATALHTGTSALNSGLATMDDKTSTMVADTEKLADGAQKVADGNEQLNQKVQTAITTARDLHTGAREVVVESTDKLVTDGILTREQADAIVKDYDARQNDQAHQGVIEKLDEASASMQALADGSKQVADGNRQLANSMPELRKGITGAHDGATKLNAGAAQLEDGLDTSVAGVGKLKAGSSKLATGAKELSDGASALASGASKIDAGAAALEEGAGDLDNGARELEAGAKKLDDGTGDLATALRDGADKVPHLTDAKKDNVSQVIGDPVRIQKIQQTQAGSYGAGLAPFFLSLALWVGVFMLVQALRPIARRALASNARSWRIALGGWIPFWLISMAQATILLLVVHFVLGLHPANLPLTWAFMLLATMAFSAIIQGTVALFGTPGKFIILILLVLQLTAAGGTLPWQLTPQPLHIVHDVLPMSHVVEGLRRLIYGSDIGSVASNAWMLVGYTALGLVLSILAAHKHKTWTLKVLDPEIAI